MKLQVLQENFSKALTTASHFTSSRAQLPVLGNILLSASKTKLSVSSTNLEISIALSIGAKIDKEGSITVPSRVITDLVSNLPSATIELEAEKEQLKISSEKFHSTVSGMNSSDFPEVPQSVGKGAFSLPKQDFLQALSQVIFAASIDETRPVLTGVLLIFKKGQLIMVATDGFRLSQKKIALQSSTKEGKLILPKNVLAEVSRLAAEEGDLLLEIRPNENQSVFALDGTILSSRVLEGEFPDFERIIPKESNIKVSLDKEELLRAVKLSSVFARDSANIVAIKVLKEVVEISSESQLAGSQEAQVEAKVEGNAKDFEISFNFRFLEEFLHAAKGEGVQMEFSSSSSPGVFIDPSDPSFLHLIMPVRIQP
ncbi:MAG: polymerase III subunit beta protein [Candidatus Woesebacteria bacterium GW2011_GWA1_45_8]|uniref:Beta sliding clamp n=1 Tax=Candidatus Woesebacteria bacterium GW2011_GWA1_45_8 TaxID=1618559 RepID=A0A0G1MVR8_9BACT|nr:MAG: polymerase III subunit beta protein [Candidatus Woesebacteria bacterium GW2011_GWA1_45_8]